MKRKNEEVRKVTVTGETGTYYVTLPKDFVRELKWRKGQNVVVKQRGRKIVVEERPSKRQG